MGVEPTGELLCRQPPYRLAPASVQRPRQESILDLNLRRVACQSSTPRGRNLVAARRGVEPRLAVSRTAVRSGTLAGCVMNQYPDLDLNQDLDLRRVQCNSATPSGQTEPTTGFAPASAGLQNRCLLQSSHVGIKHEREESNPVEQFWRLPALPGAHSCVLLVSRSEQAGYPKGVEPLPPGSQPGMQRPLHHRHHLNQQLDQDLNPELHVRTVA